MTLVRKELSAAVTSALAAAELDWSVDDSRAFPRVLRKPHVQIQQRAWKPLVVSNGAYIGKWLVGFDVFLLDPGRSVDVDDTLEANLEAFIDVLDHLPMGFMWDEAERATVVVADSPNEIAFPGYKITGQVPAERG